jgi:glycosyltransferase involved in cell wall biosynthesis
VRVLTLCNNYRSRCNGELRVVAATHDLLAAAGVDSRLLVRSSRDVETGFAAKLRASFAAPYSRRAYREVRDVLGAARFDVVHAHNVYPLLSPSVLRAARDASVPVVLTAHNFGLTCPTWHHFRAGAVCERCLGGREHRCILHNCRGDLAESTAYAVRAAVARRFRLFTENVTLLVALTRFAAERFVAAGFAPERVAVLPNMAPEVKAQADAGAGGYVAFAGRMTAEKGLDTVLAAAALVPEVPFRLAGDGPMLPGLVARAPANARFVGFLDGDELHAFYRGARLLVLPSLWYEGCPMVLLEAMAHGVPAVASRIGGLPELVEDGVTGALCEPADAAALARVVAALWREPERCRRMGAAARRRAIEAHGSAAFRDALLGLYRRAAALPPPAGAA